MKRKGSGIVAHARGKLQGIAHHQHIIGGPDAAALIFEGDFVKGHAAQGQQRVLRQ